MPNYSEPKRNQHTHSFTSTESPDQADTRGLAALKKGVKQWIPDLASMIGSIPDAAYYAARRIAQGQSNQSTPSLGVGPALARYAQSRIPNPPALRTQTEISPLEDEDPRTSLTRLVNPLMWTNPLKLAKSPEAVSLMAGLTGVPGGIGVIKEKGGNWLDPKWSRALRSMRNPWVPEQDLAPIKDRPGHWLLPDTGETFPPERAGDILRGQAVNRWISGPLRKYMEQRMGSPEDEVRQLFDQGIFHINPEGTLPRNGPDILAHKREASSYGDTLATTPAGQRWEDLIDSWIQHQTADQARSSVTTNSRGRNPTYQKDLHWLERLPPEAIVYSAPETSAHFGSRIGFDHVTDIIDQALQSGELRADNLNRLSVADAVKLTHKKNLEAEAAAAKAKLESARSPAVHTLKEYSENNPTGLRWVELKAPTPPKGQLSVDEMFDEEAARKSLQDALQYEGDIMGHCVGGYCDDVLEGRSRIFSLRDAKGEPHVTVETAPHPILPLRYPEDRAKLTNLYEQQYGVTPTDGQLGQFWVNGDYRQFMPNDIVQIKGKSNNKPNPEYIPYVQDFVKTQGPWGEVGDLHNTSLWKHPKTGQFHTLDELKSNPELEEAYSSRNLDENGQRFAEGGLVRQIGGAYLYAE